tara:strand:+ start:418 stop:2100 length:1683 start_codon:yes stop_codon:yes gene_type:complete
MLGIASVLPFIGLITDPHYFDNNTYFLYFKDFFDYNLTDTVYVVGVFIIVMFILSNASNAYVLWKTLKFSADQSHKISCRVMKKYLEQPYKYFVDSDFSVIKKNILSEASLFSDGFLLPVLQIISKTFILIALSILLIFVNHQVFFYSLIFLLIVYYLIFKVIRNTLTRYGEERTINNDIRFKNVGDLLQSIKDVKYYSAEDYYLNNFSTAQKNFSMLTAKRTLFSTLPRYLIEAFAFGGILSMMLYISTFSNGFSQYLPTLSLFLLAAYRILPLLQLIFSSITSIKFFYPAIKQVKEILALPSILIPDTSSKVKFNHSIKFKNIDFDYSNGTKILDNLSIAINKNQLTGIIGSTGVGKTTLIDLLLGFYQPRKGTIEIDGESINLQNIRLLRNIAGYVPQNIAFLDRSIAENIAFGKNTDVIDYERINEVIKCVELKEFVESLEEGYSTTIGDHGVKLSGGQCQRIGIARALYTNPSILILDEATNALDSITEQKIFKSIKKYNPDITMILITHRLSSLNICDEIVVLMKDQVILKNKKDTNLKQLEKILEGIDVKKYD